MSITRRAALFSLAAPAIARAQANDPAWVRLRNACDTYVTWRVAYPDEDNASSRVSATSRQQGTYGTTKVTSAPGFMRAG